MTNPLTLPIKNPVRPSALALVITVWALIAASAWLLTLRGAAAQTDDSIQNLRLSSPNPGELVIDWDVPSETPTDYRVTWTPSDQDFLSYKDGNTSERGNAYPTTNTHTVNGLPAGREYKVMVRARFRDGEHRSGSWSNEATITIFSPPEPTPEPHARTHTGAHARTNAGAYARTNARNA